MFAEPRPVPFEQRGYCLRGCPKCTMMPVTLILTTPKGERAETDLLCCARLPVTYLADLHALFTGRGGAGEKEIAPDHVRPVTSLEVDEIAEPSLWLNCVLWSRYRREDDRLSLEVFVRRPERSRLFYAVGKKGTALTSPEESIKIHESTVRILCGKSKNDCPDPKIYRIDEGRLRDGGPTRENK